MTTVKMKKSDIIFLFSLLAGLVLYLFSICDFPSYQDEAFYSTIALRLINGDSLVSDEWHLSQFSSLFLYLPVKLWLTVKGSTDGILLFMRSLYLCIHTGSAVGIYAFFRKKGCWAVAAAMVFYSQSPMWIMNLSYNSLFALFVIALCILLCSIYEKQKPVLCLLAGLVYGAACVCNPVFCIAVVFYAIALACIAYAHSDFRRENIMLANRSLKKRKKKERPLPQENPVHSAFFSKKSVLLFFAGLGIMVAISLVFFFATGGTLSGFAENFRQLLTDSEHQGFDAPFTALWNKLKEVASRYCNATFGLFFVPFLPFIAMAADKKRTVHKHRTVYILLGFAVSIFYFAGILYDAFLGEGQSFLMSIPLLHITVVAFVLTKNKNKCLFFCFWLPGILATVIQLMASNLTATIIAWGGTISNIAGIFLIRDLFCELQTEETDGKKMLQKVGSVALCLVVVLQCLFQYGNLISAKINRSTDTVLIESGPYENIKINREQYETYMLCMQDMDEVRAVCGEDEPVLLLSDMSWMYLYIDRPFGSYSAWQLSFEPHRLKAYFELNPEKTPKYIYVSAVVPKSAHNVNFQMAETRVYEIKKLFKCKTDRLSRGILLTVKE